MGFFGRLGGALGLTSGGGADRAEEAFKVLDKIADPRLQALALQNYSAVADPREFIKALEKSNFKNISTDPIVANAQKAALSRMQSIAEQGGLSTEDKAKLTQIRRDQAIQEQGQRGAIEQNAAARGIGGSGLSIASKLANEQGAANRAAAAGTDVLAGSDTRQMNAANLLSGMATSQRGEAFNEEAEKARAQDLIDQFNTTTQNAAGMREFENRQAIANANVGLQHQMEDYNKAVMPQQRFENQLALGQTKANALNKLGSAQTAQEGVLHGFVQGMTGGQDSPLNPNNSLMKDIMGGASMMSDRRAKKNISDGNKSIKEFLDKIGAHKFEYIDEEDGDGKHLGPMAQEMEATPEGAAAVIETSRGKMLHPGKTAALALAASKLLHERLKKVEHVRSK